MSSLYRQNVGIMLIDKNNHIFVGQKNDVYGSWQMPQGGIEEKEEPLVAALRELEEETGIVSSKVKFLTSSNRTFKYTIYKSEQDKRRRINKKQYLGQEQRWFLFRFLGTDDDFNIYNEPCEFKAWCWVRYSQLSNIVTPFKKDIYMQVLEEFEHFFTYST